MPSSTTPPSSIPAIRPISADATGSCVSGWAGSPSWAAAAARTTVTWPPSVRPALPDRTASVEPLAVGLCDPGLGGGGVAAVPGLVRHHAAEAGECMAVQAIGVVPEVRADQSLPAMQVGLLDL